MNRSLLFVGFLLLSASWSLGAQSVAGGYYAAVEIANDVLYLPLKTDRYFTSGLQVEFGRERRTKLTTSSRYWRATQHIYTPNAIDSLSLQVNDRPFASYLALTRGHRFHQRLLGFHLERSWTFGILGKYSGGGMMQNAWHDMLSYADYVPGWQHEVKPDVILNYRLQLGQELPLGRRANLRPLATARLGTLHTDLAWGLEVDWTLIRLSARRHFSLRAATSTRLVGYNATLSGGLLHRDERYRGVVRPKTLVGTFQLRGLLAFDGWLVSGGVVHLGKEFDGGLNHTWAWFGLRRGF